MTSECTLLGAEARVRGERFECTAAVEGQAPEGAEFRFVASGKDGRVVHLLAHESTDARADEGRKRTFARQDSFAEAVAPGVEAGAAHLDRATLAELEFGLGHAGRLANPRTRVTAPSLLNTGLEHDQLALAEP